jgi:hypothetical protein
MGASSSNESRFLYKIDDNLILSKIYYYAVFEKTPFSEGACRYCYLGEIKDRNDNTSYNKFFPTGKCVVKVFKKKVAKYTSDLSEDFKNSIYANKVANIFNSSSIGSNFYNLIFVLPFAASLQKYARFNLFFFIPIRNDDSMAKIKEDEWLAIEPYLDGKYEKFVSNTNKTDYKLGKAIPTFMHWNWVISKGEKVVSDIQGIEEDGYYHLTDPAVQSINQEYGSTDLGPYGILVFLARHRHNEYCINLPWPNNQIINIINSYHIISNKRTTFSFEFKKDPRIREFYMTIKNSVFGK